MVFFALNRKSILVFMCIFYCLPVSAWSQDLHEQSNVVLASDTVRILALYELGWTLRKTDPDSSKHLAQRALSDARKIDYLRGIAWSSSLLGYHSKRENHFLMSERYYQLSLKTRIKIGDPRDISNTHYNLGKLYNDQAKYGLAIAQFHKALTFLTPEIIGHKMPKEMARIQSSLGSAYRHIGDFPNAIQNLEGSLKHREEVIQSSIRVKDSTEWAKSHLNLANLYLDQGDIFNADRHYQFARPVFNKHGSWQDKGVIFNNIGLILLEKREFGEAEHSLSQAIASYEIAQDSLGIARAILNLGKVAEKRGSLQEAEMRYGQALKYYQKEENQEGISMAYHNLGQIAHQREDFKTATEYFQLAIQNIGPDPSPFFLEDLYKQLSQDYLLLDEYALASNYARDAIQIQDSINVKLLEAVFLANQLQMVRADAALLREKQTTLKEKLEKTATRDFMLAIILAILFFLLLITWLALLQRKKLFRTEKEKNKAIIKAEQNATRIREVLSKQEYKLLVAMSDGQENERHRIAKELHDSMGALLASAKLKSQSLTKTAEGNNGDPQKHKDLESILEEAIEEVRRISHNLMSGTLWKFGLPPALKDLKNTISSTGEVKFHLNMHGFQNSERLDFKFELAVYRIVQELVTNSLRHANASTIEVLAVREKEQMNLMVIDDGVGFTYDQSHSTGGIGLKNISARIVELNGSLSIDSDRGNGSHISISLPINIPKTIP